jgi:Ca2+-binding EF-hand superfamily protein
MKEFVVVARIKNSESRKVKKTIFAKDKEEAINKFFEIYDNPKAGYLGREDIYFESAKEVTEENRDNFY